MQRWIVFVFFMLFAIDARSDSHAKIFLGLDRKNEAKAEFATMMIAKTLRNTDLAAANPAARLFVVGEATSFLISGNSPLEKEMNTLLNEGKDLQIISCGKAMPVFRKLIDDGKAVAIRGVRFVESCDAERDSFVKDGWFEVVIPDVEQ